MKPILPADPVVLAQIRQLVEKSMVWQKGTKIQVWQKGTKIQNFDPSVWRRDSFGNVMRFSDYGDRSSKYGWEIDHIIPLSGEGKDDLANKQPLNWASNTTKSDKFVVRCRAPQG